jgi:hypothetical protein
VQEILSHLQQLARQRAGAAGGPLVAVRSIPATTGQRARHLPLLPVLAQAWTALTGEPPRPHQAAAVPIIRRGEPLALMADDPTVELTAQLLLYDALLAEPRARALYLLPDADALAAQDHALAQLDQLVPGAPQRALIDGRLALRGRLPQLLLATPDALHSHILRHHERAWRELWGVLSLVLLSDAHRYAGVAAAHLAALLLRVHRLAAAAENLPRTLVTLVRLEQPQPAVEALTGGLYRIQPADDGPRPATSLLLWRAGADRLRAVNQLVTSLHGAGFSVGVAAPALELALLEQSLGDVAAIGAGGSVLPGQALLSLGLPAGLPGLRRALAAGHEAVVLLLADTPHDRLLAERPDICIEGPLEWMPPPANAYIDAQHLRCAASELPLRDAEVEAWQVEGLVERMEAQGRLARLPGDEGGWQPRGDDPYAGFSLLGTDGSAALARDLAGTPLAELDPAQFDRLAFVGAALPPVHGSLRVTHRDEDALTVLARFETGGRRCLPLRRCSVTLREERSHLLLNCGQPSGWGRVLVEETIYGFREPTPDNGAGEQRLNPPLDTRWTAPAWWIELPAPLKPEGQLVGWCLASAVAIRTVSHFADLAPCYDAPSRRLYLVEAQPGGNGLGEWLFSRAEELLPLAYDAALACRGDALIEPIGRLDMDWLLPLLGRPRQPARSEPPRSEPSHPAPPAAGEQPLLLDLGPRRESSHHDTTGSRRQPPQPSDEDTLSRLLDAPPGLASSPPPTPPWPVPQPADPPPLRPVEPASPEPAPDQSTSEPFDAMDVSWPPDPPRPEPMRATAAPPSDARAALPWNAPPAEEPKPSHANGNSQEPAPDANAMIARMRRLREQRAAAAPRTPSRPQPAASEAPVEPRFSAGDRIFCLPFGDGLVRESRIVGGQELLRVAFADYGEIEIDLAVSLVRRLDDDEGQPDEAE